MESKNYKVDYEDALNATGWGKFNYLMFTMYCFIIAASMVELYSVSYLVPASACELKTTSAQQGLVAGLPIIGVVSTAFLWGYLADKKGRKSMLCVILLIGFVTGALASLSTNWIMLCALKLLSSATVAGASALAITLLGECSPAKQRSAVVMMMIPVMMGSTGLLAAIAMPILPLKFSYYIPGLNIYFNSWRVLNLVFTIPTIISVVCSFCSCESPKYLLSIGDEKKAMDTLRMIFAMNTGKPKDEYQVKSVILGEVNGTSDDKGFIASVLSQIVPMFKAPLLKDTLLLSTSLFIAYICYNPFLVWLPAILNAFMSSVENEARGLTICEMIRLSQNNTQSVKVEEADACAMNNTAMSLALIMCCIIAFASVIVGYILNCFGKKRLFLLIQITCSIAGFTINFSSFWILSAFLFFLILFEIINFGLLMTYPVDVFPTYIKATAVCLMLMFARGSAILGITAMKRLLDYNCELAFYIFGILSTVAVILGFLLPKDKRFVDQKVNESKSNEPTSIDPS